jgi:integrase
MPLSDTTIRAAKPGDKPRKLADGGGMYLLLNPNGSKWWRLKYRIGGKEKLLSLGTYPETNLKEARAKRDEARRLLAAGIDPGAHRKASKAAGVERAANSFETVAREWHSKQAASWSPGNAKIILRRLEADAFPWLGSRPVSELTAAEILVTLRRIENRGAVETAHRILQYISTTMRYAIATSRAERNPAADLKGALPPATTEHRAAITDPKQAGALLRAIDAYEGSFVTKCALRLAPLLFVRPGELRKAEWSEFDLDTARWEIPAERMKMRTANIVPLSTQAVEILKELHALTGRGRYVFPGARSPRRPMSDNAVLAALRRMGFAKDEMSGHGFRAMARTILDEVLGYRPDLIEQQLAHAVRDPLGRAYNRTAHLPDRTTMMQGWADYLDTLKTGANVTPIRKNSGASR